MHIIFDLDGTLVDSELVMESAWKRCREDFGLIAPFDEYRKYLGRPFFEILDQLGIGSFGHEKIFVYQRIKEKYVSESLKNIEKVEFFPGARDFLAFLEKKNLEWSIITSRNEVTATAIIDRLGMKPKFLHCDGSTGLSKPNANIIKNLLYKRIEVAEATVLYYFGDMLVDLVFSVNAGMHYIHCNFGSYGPLPRSILPRVRSIDSWDSAIGQLEIT